MYDIFFVDDEEDSSSTTERCAREAFQQVHAMGITFWPLDETLVYMMHGSNIDVVRFGTRESKEKRIVLNETCVVEIHSFRRDSMDVATSPVNDLKRAYPSMELRSMTRGELSRFSAMETSTRAQTVVDPYLYLMLGGYEVQSKCGVGSTSSSSSSSWYLHWVEPLLKSDVGMHFLHLNDDIFLPSPHRRFSSSPSR